VLDILLIIIDSSLRILLFGILELVIAFTGYGEENEDKFSRTHCVLRARYNGMRITSYSTYLEWLSHYKEAWKEERV
jgi:hypothetical protein